MERRDFFRSLVAGGATVTQRAQARNRRAKHQDFRAYHGPMLIPQHVAEAVRESPDLARSTHRHLVARYNDADGTVYRFRCRVPESRAMVGEITVTQDGGFRVHCWSAATPTETYRQADELIRRTREYLTPTPMESNNETR